MIESHIDTANAFVHEASRVGFIFCRSYIHEKDLMPMPLREGICEAFLHIKKIVSGLFGVKIKKALAIMHIDHGKNLPWCLCDSIHSLPFAEKRTNQHLHDFAKATGRLGMSFLLHSSSLPPLLSNSNSDNGNN
jgi:hypothetical protein